MKDPDYKGHRIQIMQPTLGWEMLQFSYSLEATVQCYIGETVYFFGSENPASSKRMYSESYNVEYERMKMDSIFEARLM